MQAGDVRLGRVFANDQQNVIPLFQRPYVWDESKNWEPLWQDIRQAAEEVEREASWGGHHQDARTYFLGAVVLQQRRKPPQRILSWNVVDGQQRLTTLQILFSAARAVAHDLGAKSLSARYSSLIENHADIVHEDFPDDRYKVWPLPQDREVFLWAVRHPGDELPPSEPDHRIVRARIWFEAEIREWVMEAEDPVERLEYLHETLKERMELVQITLESTDDPQVIFEVLNHRGVPLDAADLIKNLLFQELDTKDDPTLADKLLMNVWLPLDRKPWRGEVTIGRTKRNLIDLLLFYWLTIATVNEVSVDHLFADFKKWLHDSDMGATGVIRSIRHYADRMESLRALPSTDFTAQLIDRMESTQTTTPWPLLLYLYGNDIVPDEQRQRAAVAIDSFLMRRGVCRLSTKDYNRLFLQVLAAAKEGNALNAGEIVENALLAQTAESRKWPTDAEFFQALTQPNIFNLLIRARLKALLIGLENNFRTSKTEFEATLLSSDPKLNIEHIMPRSWEKYWQLPASSQDEGRDESVRRRWDDVNRLGNLTLTTTKMNPSLSNKAWKHKKKDLDKYSLLLLTRGSVLTAPLNEASMDDEHWEAEWDEERILIRGKWLAEQAILAWPRPT